MIFIAPHERCDFPLWSLKKGVPFADRCIVIYCRDQIIYALRTVHAGSDQSTWSVMGGVPSFV